MDRRFFHPIGASLLDRTICSMAGHDRHADDGRREHRRRPGRNSRERSRAALGHEHAHGESALWPFVLEARERGAPIIAIDPIRTRTAAQCDEWIAIRPGTDAALALGMMHVVFERGLRGRRLHRALHDRHRRSCASARASTRPSASARSPAFRAETIVSLGERYGRAKAAFIRVNYGLQRHAGGGMAVRTIACLPALTGHWRRAGGGVQLSSSANFQFDKRALERPDLSPPVRTINMIRLGEALTTPDAGVGGPPVRALIVYNSNPGRGRAGPERGAARHGARGSVHRRARAFPDRHRRLRRHRAPGDDAARALGPACCRTAITT